MQPSYRTHMQTNTVKSPQNIFLAGMIKLPVIDIHNAEHMQFLCVQFYR
jgi:hypothetical protein